MDATPINYDNINVTCRRMYKSFATLAKTHNFETFSAAVDLSLDEGNLQPGRTVSQNSSCAPIT